ncbi:MAG TPA: hypothetical protein DD706_23925 [Nitrospiraceae bacterium]|nr:hypothetical protein [Nitrospiraceae bacterium]
MIRPAWPCCEWRCVTGDEGVKKSRPVISSLILQVREMRLSRTIHEEEGYMCLESKGGSA